MLPINYLLFKKKIMSCDYAMLFRLLPVWLCFCNSFSYSKGYFQHNRLWSEAQTHRVIRPPLILTRLYKSLTLRRDKCSHRSEPLPSLLTCFLYSFHFLFWIDCAHIIYLQKNGCKCASQWGACYITVCIGLCAAMYDRTSIVALLVEKGGVEIVKCFVLFWFFF